MNFAFNSDLYWPRYVHVSCNLKSKQTSQKKLVLFLKKTDYRKCVKPGLLEDPVIEAIARLEFEDGLRTEVLPGVCWYPYGNRTYIPQDQFQTPLRVRVASLVGVVVIRTPVRSNTDCRVLCINGV